MKEKEGISSNSSRNNTNSDNSSNKLKTNLAISTNGSNNSDTKSKNCIVKFDNVSKWYGKKQVLNSVDLEIYEREIFGMIGMTGSGKTTFLNILIGFIFPEEGDILFRLPHLVRYEATDDFRSIFEFGPEVKKSFGFASQKPSFYPSLTVLENLQYFASLYSLSKETAKSNIEALLKLTNLSDSRNMRGSELSGGMAKKLDIACSLIHDPKILIMDEPTADLDSISRDEVLSMIRTINNAGTTIIISSHILGEIERLCDRVAIIHNKTIAGVGTLDELRENYSKDMEVRIRTNEPNYEPLIKHLKTQAIINSYKLLSDNTIIFYTKSPPKVLNNISKFEKIHHGKIMEIQINKPTLQEIFESLVKKN